MMEPTKAKRRRVKTGCLTCRRRRVRCDEIKPRCGACEHMTLECSYPLAVNKPGIVQLKDDRAEAHQLNFSNFWELSELEDLDVTKHALIASNQYGWEDDTQTTSSSSYASTQTSPKMPFLVTNISPLSLLPRSSDSKDLRSHMRLHHHFTSVLIPEMEKRSPFMEVVSDAWRTEIAAMSFASESLLHSFLALAAKDLAFKSTSPADGTKALELQTIHEGQALQCLASDLNEAVLHVPTVMSVLLLIWLSIVTDRFETAVKHFQGLEVIISRMPESTFASASGREMARMFIALDVTRAALRNASNRPLNPATTWISKQLQLSEQVPSDSQLMYELITILSKMPIIPDITFLELASRSTTAPVPVLETIYALEEELQQWRAKTRRSPSFRVVRCSAPTEGDLGSLVYATPVAAILMAYYFTGLIRFADESRFLCGEIKAERQALVIIHQIANGALESSPSPYTTHVLDMHAPLNIFRTLFACATTSNFQEYRAWENRLYKTAVEQSSETVLNLNSLYTYNSRRLLDDICLSYFGIAGLRLASKLGPPGLRKDFRMREYFLPQVVDGIPQSSTLYCAWSGGSVSPRIIVINQTTEQAGQPPVLEPDWELTEHWNELVQTKLPVTPKSEHPLSDKILRHVEHVLSNEMLELERHYASIG